VNELNKEASSVYENVTRNSLGGLAAFPDNYVLLKITDLYDPVEGNDSLF